KTVWLDLSAEKLTPDGGCISSEGRIFIAIWDGFKIIELDIAGNIVDEFKIPIPRPTSCVLDSKEDRLFVTSAYEGLSGDKRKNYPLSGSIIEVDVRC
ncbi:MAG: SMP-30/gluconolactonase/LRE family protein, partial [Gammaproteobacteria bacterium]